MRTRTAFLALFLISIPVSQAWGDDSGDMDASSADALVKTQNMLKDKSAREKVIGADNKTVEVDKFVKKLTGGNAETSDEIYALAADVFAQIAKDSHGDGIKMKEEMDKFIKDPGSFANTWTPEQKARLKKLSEKIPDSSGDKPH